MSNNNVEIPITSQVQRKFNIAASVYKFSISRLGSAENEMLRGVWCWLVV